MPNVIAEVGANAVRTPSGISAGQGLIWNGDGWDPADLAEKSDLNPPLVSALPSNPSDGDRVYFLADAVAGIIWHLRYRATSPNGSKWEFLGGQSLDRYNFDQSLNFTVAKTWTYQPFTTACSITVPLAGLYDMECSAIASATNGASKVQLNVTNSGVSPTQSWFLPAEDHMWIPQGADYRVANSGRATFACSKGDVLRLCFLHDTTTNWVTWQDKHLKVTPVRVS